MYKVLLFLLESLASSDIILAIEEEWWEKGGLRVVHEHIDVSRD